MQPKIPIRPSVWSHNTSYVGAAGLHSENSPSARARKNSIDNRLNKVISVLKNMERRDLQKLDKSRRDIKKSMLAYTEKVKEINARKHFYSSAENSLLSSNTEPQSDRSSQTSSGSERNNTIKGKLPAVKNRRVSLPKIGLANQKRVRQRRLSSFSDSATLTNSVSSDTSRLVEKNPSVSQTLQSSEDEASENQSTQNKGNHDYLTISPFPYESYDGNISSLSSSASKSKSQTQTRKRVSYKQYMEEKEIERERMLLRKKANLDNDPFDHSKEILREQAKHKREAMLLDKARQEALRSKKDICNTFCYSFAMEELLKKSNPLAYTASEKDFVSKVEVDQNGTIKQTFGPAVLTIIGVDELNNFQGMRIKWSAKYRQQNNEGNERSEEESLLPPINVGGRKQSVAREESSVTLKQSLSRDVTREQIQKMYLDAQSVSTRKRRKKRRKSKSMLSSMG